MIITLLMNFIIESRYFVIEEKVGEIEELINLLLKYKKMAISIGLITTIIIVTSLKRNFCIMKIWSGEK